MPSQHPLPPEPLASLRQPRSGEPSLDPSHPHDAHAHPPDTETPARIPRPSRRNLRLLALIAILLAALAVGAVLAGRIWLRNTMRASLPQIDGTLFVSGLSAPVTVDRDAHGVPTLRAQTIDDLVFAQAFITAGDRLFQMDALRRHAAGELAEIFGSSLLEHDRSQRTLQIRTTADAALAQLPPAQLHALEVYARGVNAGIDAQRAHLPIEFRLLSYQPRPWLPRDSLLVALVMFEDLTNRFPEKLNREALTARLAPNLPPEEREQLLLDLYPVGSWRDHPPSRPVVDLTTPVDEIPEIPLDDSQVKLHRPPPPSPSNTPAHTPSNTPSSMQDLLALGQTLAPSLCPGCRPGSNNWVVSGARTATGRPLLSNDMHLSLTVPGIWYTANLQAPLPNSAEPFHVAGVTLPGTPFVIVGHNRHVAWGLTNLGADVQDLYIEHLRGTGEAQEFATPDGAWRPVLHQQEIIHIRGSADQVLDVISTSHGSSVTPIISSLVHSERRAISLRWVIYDPGVLTSPFLDIDSAPDAATLVSAFRAFGGPSQNLVYADDRGHIGYHATGHIPLRGPLVLPSQLSSVPTDATALNAPSHEWSTSVPYIPYDQLPQVLDPPDGILATANARITPDAYPLPITDNWGDPYRNERIWKLLSGREHLSPADMLAIQSDVYSDPDRVIAQRMAYAIDHANLGSDSKRLHQAADLLRSWNGKVTSDSAPAAIVDAARAALWPLLLNPKFPAARLAEARSDLPGDPSKLYLWGERAFAEEQLIMHTPARWLPPPYATWDDLLASAVSIGLRDSHAPSNLGAWRFGAVHPLDIQHPVFGQSVLLGRLAGTPTGIHSQLQSGDGTTIKQVGRSFGPSERFTADLSDPNRANLNLVLGESGNPASPFFLDQFPAWLHVTTFPLPFDRSSQSPSGAHSLTLNPR